jgi:tRNA-dihydrouridine synthase B
MSSTLILAPMRGITEAAFRDIFVRFFPGFDRAVAPFISTFQGSRFKPAKFRDLLPENNRRLPVVPQILCKNADHFIATARLLAELGYTTVNWNLGCPYPMVANKMRGSGLLPFPEKIEGFLDKVHQEQPLAISVKTRLGRREPQEIFALLPRCMKARLIWTPLPAAWNSAVILLFTMATLQIMPSIKVWRNAFRRCKAG